MINLVMSSWYCPRLLKHPYLSCKFLFKKNFQGQLMNSGCRILQQSFEPFTLGSDINLWPFLSFFHTSLQTLGAVVQHNLNYILLSSWLSYLRIYSLGIQTVKSAVKSNVLLLWIQINCKQHRNNLFFLLTWPRLKYSCRWVKQSSQNVKV